MCPSVQHRQKDPRAMHFIQSSPAQEAALWRWSYFYTAKTRRDVLFRLVLRQLQNHSSTYSRELALNFLMKICICRTLIDQDGQEFLTETGKGGNSQTKHSALCFVLHQQCLSAARVCWEKGTELQPNPKRTRKMRVLIDCFEWSNWQCFT